MAIWMEGVGLGEMDLLCEVLDKVLEDDVVRGSEEGEDAGDKVVLAVG